MPRRVLIGIDAGTTVLKAAAFDRSTGKMLASHSLRLCTVVGSGGEREQDAHKLWLATRKLLREVLRALGRFDTVVGIGLAAQGGSAVVVDQLSGQPKSPLFLWNDMRFLPYMDVVRSAHPHNYWRRLSQRDEPGWGLARMLWLRDSHPGLLEGDTLYVGAGEFIYYHLTGVWQQDACNANQIGCYDVAHQSLSCEPLKSVGVSLDKVAPLRCGAGSNPLSREASNATGLPEGVEVIGPYMDHEAGFMSVEGSRERPVQCSLGTAWVGNYNLDRNACVDSPFHFVMPGPLGGDSLAIQPLLTGNVCWDWALTSFLDPQIGKALKKADAVFEEKLLPDDNLMALPWLNSPNALWPDCLGSGAFFGANTATDRAELVRAVAFSMVCELRRVFDEPVTTGLIRSLIITGGAGKGTMFRRLISALFAPLTVHIVKDEDWFGTRGVLRPLSSRVGRAATTTIKAPPASGVNDLACRYKRYIDLYCRLYKGVRAGEAIRVKSRRVS